MHLPKIAARVMEVLAVRASAVMAMAMAVVLMAAITLAASNSDTPLPTMNESIMPKGKGI